jgi:hypothetical protein
MRRLEDCGDEHPYVKSLGEIAEKLENLEKKLSRRQTHKLQCMNHIENRVCRARKGSLRIR